MMKYKCMQLGKPTLSLCKFTSFFFGIFLKKKVQDVFCSCVLLEKKSNNCSKMFPEGGEKTSVYSSGKLHIVYFELPCCTSPLDTDF